MRPTILLEFLLVAPWIVLGFALLFTKRGWTYGALKGSKAAKLEARAARDMGLGFTGLVFAGLAVTVSGSSNDPAARAASIELLTIALAGSVIASIASNYAALAWAAIVAAAGLIAGLGGVLLAVAEVLNNEPVDRLVIAVPIGLAYAVLLTHSIYLAYLHGLGAQIAPDLRKILGPQPPA